MPCGGRGLLRSFAVNRRVFLSAGAGALAAAALPRPAARNYILGSQSIGATYQFTNETLLVETAQALLDMGSNLIKFTIGRGYERMMLKATRAAFPETIQYLLNQGAAAASKPRWQMPGAMPVSTPPDPSIRTLTGLASREPSYRRVFNMPFSYYLLWTYSFTPDWWLDGFSPESRKLEYREIYNLTAHLLKTYSGTGKTFFLGHWEGDWHLRPWQLPWFRQDGKVTDTNLQGMVDWLAARQKAVDDAKRAVPHHDVQVYHYTEANLVHEAIAGHPTVGRDVIPKVDLDYVSYSAYDSLADIGRQVPAALDYLESRLRPKPSLRGPRVFIGEYGFAARTFSEAERDRKSREVMRAGLEHGCPFILCWQMYNNEYSEGAENGYWLIDDKRNKTPLWHTHHDFYAAARTYRGSPTDFPSFALSIVRRN
jgi:hypothetical protein